MKVIFLFFITFAFPLLAASKSHQEAFMALVEGNKRFMEEQVTLPDRNEQRRIETSNKQEPFAIIVGCSDSRVAPEIIFDQGLGDLFIVRDAGNVVGPVELDSIEYALSQLGSSFILVMGHANCGAVQAVMEGKTADIEAVASLIEPALKRKNARDSVEQAVKANVLNTVANLKTTPLIKRLLEEKKIDVRGGYYNFVSGQVEML